MKYSPFLLICLFLLFKLSAQNILQDELDAAIKANKQTILLTQKEYRIATPISLVNLKNITIDGKGAKIIMTRKNNIMNVLKSDNLTICNLIFDYDPLPFTQGVISKINGRDFEVVIDDGYPKLNKDYVGWNLHVFTADGKYWKRGTADLYAKPISWEMGRIRYNALAPLSGVTVGDRIAIDNRTAACIDLRNTSNICFKNITIWASPGCAFRNYHSDGGDRYENVKIMRGPKPAEATQERLLSTNADGLNYGYCRKGPTVRNCEFSFMADDSINLHGSVLAIAEVTGKHTFNQILSTKTTRSDLLSRFRPGDKLRILSRDNFKIIGEYTYRSHRFIDKKYPVAVRNRAFPQNTCLPEESQSVIELSVEEEITFSGEAFYDSPTMNCHNYRIENSYFHDHRARGLRIMASHGVISDCRFERIKGAAVSIGTEYNAWREAGWVNDIVVRNCIFRDNADRYSRYVPGVISIFVQLNSYLDVYPGNRRISIENNLIEGANGPGIFIAAADGVEVRGNRLKNTATDKQYGTVLSGFSDKISPIQIEHSKCVNIANDNSVSNIE